MNNTLNRIITLFVFTLCVSVLGCSLNSTISPNNTFSSSDNVEFHDILGRKDFYTINNIQDGCIYENHLFIFNSVGTCFIYDAIENSFLCESTLPSYSNLTPHSNSACFGNKINDDDDYPLLYLNLYNNCKDFENDLGMCFVYQIDRTKNNFDFTLLQIIKIGFAGNSELWRGRTDSISPYGNFLVKGKELFVYVNDFGSNLTRFFVFDLPEFNSDNFSYILLDELDLKSVTDLVLFRYIQGGCVFKDLIISLEGFGTSENPSILRILNLRKKNYFVFDLAKIIENGEPELIDILDGFIFIANHDGHVFCFEINDLLSVIEQ